MTLSREGGDFHAFGFCLFHTLFYFWFFSSLALVTNNGDKTLRRYSLTTDTVSVPALREKQGPRGGWVEVET